MIKKEYQDTKDSCDGVSGNKQPEKKPFSLSKGYLLFPAMVLDMIGVCILVVALTLTSASSWQMLMGNHHIVGYKEPSNVQNTDK